MKGLYALLSVQVYLVIDWPTGSVYPSISVSASMSIYLSISIYIYMSSHICLATDFHIWMHSVSAQTSFTSIYRPQAPLQCLFPAVCSPGAAHKLHKLLKDVFEGLHEITWLADFSETGACIDLRLKAMFLQYVLKHRTTAATCTIGAIDAAAAVLVRLSTALLRTLADLFTRSLLTGMASATTCNIG